MERSSSTKVAEVAPAPKVPVEAAAGETTETAEVSTEQSSSDDDSSDVTRYNELSAKFKDNPNNLAAEELPEFFDLCAKLGVSPNS